MPLIPSLLPLTSLFKSQVNFNSAGVVCAFMYCMHSSSKHLSSGMRAAQGINEQSFVWLHPAAVCSNVVVIRMYSMPLQQALSGLPSTGTYFMVVLPVQAAS